MGTKPARRQHLTRASYCVACQIAFLSTHLDAFNPGLSSIVDNSGQIHPFKISSVKGPSHKIMLVEEQVSHSPGESWEPDNANAPLVNDGRFEVGGDDITIRHTGRGNVIFVDGHAAPVPPKFWQARGRQRELPQPGSDPGQ